MCAVPRARSVRRSARCRARRVGTPPALARRASSAAAPPRNPHRPLRQGWGATQLQAATRPGSNHSCVEARAPQGGDWPTVPLTIRRSCVGEPKRPTSVAQRGTPSWLVRTGSAIRRQRVAIPDRRLRRLAATRRNRRVAAARQSGTRWLPTARSSPSYRRQRGLVVGRDREGCHAVRTRRSRHWMEQP